MTKNKLMIFGASVVIALTLIAVFAPFIATYDPTEINIKAALLSPSAVHVFGTDSLGRDLFSRMVYGARVSLFIGFVAVGISIMIGIMIGSIAGYYGGRIDSLLMRFVDMMLCFPSFFLILSLVAILEPNIVIIMTVIGLTSWMGPARLIRAEILSLKEREFIQAAKITGLNDCRIIMRHLIPNAIGPVLVNAVLGIGAAILIESSLSFLGIGVQPPMPSWGNILMEGKATLGICWWITILPGLAIFITVLGYNLLGEGLRDILSPRKNAVRD
ncbi:MAG: ABC transporter permease [Candidatus Omnitrophica bacterium]|nr:ABC transporter permease [Candidatus Omnitrophota bacterium]